VHEFNPGITPSGLFWLIQISDSAVQITDDTVTIHLQNAAVTDQFVFPNGAGNVPATVSFDVTFTKSGSARRIRRKSNDPLSPFNWAGTMSSATNSGSLSAAYNDGSFSAQGRFDSSGQFGEIGTERNGAFVENTRAKESAQTTSQASEDPHAVDANFGPSQLTARARAAMNARSHLANMLGE
jgi:hypothetical protein